MNKQNLLNALAFATLALGGGSSWAEGVVQAEAILSGAAYLVSDLRADDGVEAYARIDLPLWATSETWKTHFSAGAYRSDLGLIETVQDVDSALFSEAEWTTVAAPGVQGTVSGSSQFLSASANLTDVQAFLAAVSLGTSDWQSMETLAVLNPLEGYRLVVGAHTSVDLTGFMNSLLSIDQQALLDAPEVQAVLQQGQAVSFKAWASVQVSLVDASAPCCASYQFSFNDRSTQLLIDPLTGAVQSFDGPESGPLQLTFVNDTDQEVERILDLRTIVSVSAAVLPIPEPGTWALMGLGLVGIAAVVRRQSA